MICSECGEKMVLERLGCISLSACYECKACGFRVVLALREAIAIPSSELFELLENMPLSQPDKEQRIWLAELDEIIDKSIVQSQGEERGMSRAKEILINDTIRQTHYTTEYLGSLSLENLADLVDWLFGLEGPKNFRGSASTTREEK